jgi:arylsulfatase A-like enzyme
VSRNVIVVMLDTLQFNYLGCYGNTWIRTPNIDRFSKQGVLFENAYTEGLPTIPCRRAMFTGRYTLPVKGWSQLDIDDTTIADLCWGHPIDTALIGDAGPLRLPKFGYSRGFDKVHFIHGHETDHQYYARDELAGLRAEDYFEDHVMQSADAILGEQVVRPLLNQVECHLKERQYWKSDDDQHAAQVMKAASRYLENADRNKSFFLWVDCFDPHEPWDPPSVYDRTLACPYDPDYKGKDMFLPIQGHVQGLYTEPELHHIRMLYAEKVTMVDKWFGWLMGRIRALGLEDDTLVLLVSDHGCPMGNGEHGHGIMRKCRPWPYEELAHIPMILRGRGLPRGTRVPSFVQSCDVAPTVVDWLGIGVHPSMQGKSLLPLANGEVEGLRDFAVAGYFRYSWSIITPDWSFIHWLKDEEKTVADSRFGMYGRDLAQATAHLLRTKKLNAVEDRDTAFYMRAYEEYKKAATLDGEDQWTCTAASSGEVPARDELYDRAADPFQLKNVAAEQSDVARDLFERLRLFMAELRASDSSALL